MVEEILELHIKLLDSRKKKEYIWKEQTNELTKKRKKKIIFRSPIIQASGD